MQRCTSEIAREWLLLTACLFQHSSRHLASCLNGKRLWEIAHAHLWQNVTWHPPASPHVPCMKALHSWAFCQDFPDCPQNFLLSSRQMRVRFFVTHRSAKQHGTHDKLQVCMQRQSATLISLEPEPRCSLQVGVRALTNVGCGTGTRYTVICNVADPHLRTRSKWLGVECV